MPHQLLRFRQFTRVAVSLVTVALLAACGDASPPTQQPTPSPAPSAGLLPGQPTAKAIAAVPDSTFRPRSQDYTTGHPDLPGMRVSFNTVLVGIRPDATVAGINTLLQRLGAAIVGGIAGKDGGPGALMVLRLPTTTHAGMSQALTVLRAAPEVLVATSDMVTSVQAVTRAGTTDVAWFWTSGDYAGDPNLGTWGLAAIRAPQMWNLNPHLRAEARTVVTGVLDLGFDTANEDLRNVSTMVGRQRAEDHGTQVASIIGAEHLNGIGMDGTNPFARLFLGTLPIPDADTTFTDGSITLGLIALLKARPEIRVVNVSLGYRWTAASRPSTNIPSREQAADAGTVADLALQILEFTQPLPVIVSAAGNNSGEQAVFGSGLNYAGLKGSNGNAAIIVVEADRAVHGTTAVTYARAAFSDIVGHLSAPGQRVPGALIGTSNYAFDDGTSFAAPYVTGIVGYMLALKPNLPAPTRERNVIRELLLRTTNRGPSRNGQSQVDGYAAALELDTFFGTDGVLLKLLDIDDGTADGNTRIDPFTRAPVLTHDVRADTTIDMADFRRWRDLMSAIEFETSAVFDGAEDHPKRDLNGDGLFGTVKQENMFPFADFNGDGQLSLTAVAPMAGVLRARGPLTDLQVLQSRFSDSTYSAADLDLLTASGDVHLRTTFCVPSPDQRIRVRVTRVGGGFTKEYIFAPGDTQTVLTVPVLPIPSALTPYTVRTSRIDAAGTELIGRDTTVQVTLAGDVTSAGGCAQAVVTSVTVTPTAQVLGVGMSRTYTAVAREANGAVVTGRIVSWSSTNTAVATVSTGVPTSGSATVVAVAAGTTTIRARVSGVEGTTTVSVSPAASFPVISSTDMVLLIIDLIGTVGPRQGMSATRGTAPYTWSLAPGAVFANPIVLAADGTLSGQCLICLDPIKKQFLSPPGISDPPVRIIVRDANGLTGEADVILRYIRGF